MWMPMLARALLVALAIAWIAWRTKRRRALTETGRRLGEFASDLRRHLAQVCSPDLRKLDLEIRMYYPAPFSVTQQGVIRIVGKSPASGRDLIMVYRRELDRFLAAKENWNLRVRIEMEER